MQPQQPSNFSEDLAQMQIPILLAAESLTLTDVYCLLQISAGLSTLATLRAMKKDTLLRWLSALTSQREELTIRSLLRTVLQQLEDIQQEFIGLVQNGPSNEPGTNYEISKPSAIRYPPLDEG